jgi:hypothetical protein
MEGIQMDIVQVTGSRQDGKGCLVSKNKLIKFGNKEMTIDGWSKYLRYSLTAWAYWRKKGLSYESIIEHFIKVNERRERNKLERIARYKARRKRIELEKMKREYDDAQAEIYDEIEGCW